MRIVLGCTLETRLNHGHGRMRAEDRKAERETKRSKEKQTRRKAA